MSTEKRIFQPIKFISRYMILEIKKKNSGAEGNRTPVQTYSSKAFYMFISLLIVGAEQEMNKPIQHLAG